MVESLGLRKRQIFYRSAP